MLKRYLCLLLLLGHFFAYSMESDGFSEQQVLSPLFPPPCVDEYGNLLVYDPQFGQYIIVPPLPIPSEQQVMDFAEQQRIVYENNLENALQAYIEDTNNHTFQPYYSLYEQIKECRTPKEKEIFARLGIAVGQRALDTSNKGDAENALYIFQQVLLKTIEDGELKSNLRKIQRELRKKFMAKSGKEEKIVKPSPLPISLPNTILESHKMVPLSPQLVLPPDQPAKKQKLPSIAAPETQKIIVTSKDTIARAQAYLHDNQKFSEGIRLLREVMQTSQASKEEQEQAAMQLANVYAKGLCIKKKMVLQKNPKRALEYYDHVYRISGVFPLEAAVMCYTEKMYENAYALFQKIGNASTDIEITALTLWYIGIMKFCGFGFEKSEENRTLGLKNLLGVMDAYGMRSELDHLIKVLPGEFFAWVDSDLSKKYNTMKAQEELRKENDLVNLTPELTQKYTDWFYIAGRICFASEDPRAKKRKILGRDFINFALLLGNYRACLYAAVHNPYIDLETRHQNIHGACLRRSSFPTNVTSDADLIVNEFSKKGHLEALVRTYIGCEQAGEELTDFPPVIIRDSKRSYADILQRYGMLQKLEQKASSSWIAQGLLSLVRLNDILLEENVTADVIAAVKKEIKILERLSKQNPGKLEPSVANATSWLAHCYLKLSRTGDDKERKVLEKKSLECYQQALQIFEDHKALFDLANYYAFRRNDQKGNGQKGIEYCRTLIDKKSEYTTRALELLAAYYIESNQLDSADSIINKLEENEAVLLSDEFSKYEKKRKDLREFYNYKKKKIVKESVVSVTLPEGEKIDFALIMQCFGLINKAVECCKTNPETACNYINVALSNQFFIQLLCTERCKDYRNKLERMMEKLKSVHLKNQTGKNYLALLIKNIEKKMALLRAIKPENIDKNAQALSKFLLEASEKRMK